MKVSRILHAGYLFEAGSTQLIFDPIFESPFSVNCYAFPKVAFDTTAISQLRLDAIFISHFHDDHCSIESLKLLNRSTPIYFYCLFDELFQILRGLGFQNVFPLHLNEAVSVGDFKITSRRALDADVDCIFQIETGVHKVLSVVDSWIDDETLELLCRNGPWDVVLWPFQTLREVEAIAPSHAEPASGRIPPEWIPQLCALRPRALVPSSCQFIFEDWSWLNRTFFPISYQGFARQMAELLPETAVLRLNPGCSLILDGDQIERGSPLGWIHPDGDQDVDYIYDPSVSPSRVSEIAARFPKLEASEKARVEDFIKIELPEKLRSLVSDGRFFDAPEVWQLAVYDGDDSVQQFYFRISKNGVAPIAEEACGWRTEIIGRKLFAALEQGESLSSLYLRINAGQSVDILEDPLIRSLYSGRAGSYQKAQLCRVFAES